MGIQINGNTDIISAVDGSLTVSGADFTSISAGSASAPSISPSGDSNTGIFFPSADTIAFAEGGVEAARFDSSGRLGIGTNNPSNLIHLYSTSDGAELLQLEIGAQPVSSEKAKIIWKATQTNGQSAKLASIGSTAVSNWGGEFQIFTKPANGTPNDTILERVRIDNAGRMTLPYQPAFQTTGTNYSQSGAAYSIIIPSGVPYNQGSHYNGSTGRFTAPVAGRYLFGFWGLSYPHNTEVNQIRGFVNGSATGQEVQFNGTSSQHEECSGTLLLNLNANDVFDWRYYQASGSAKAYGSQWNMWGYLIG